MTASIDLLSLDPVPCIIDNQPVGDKSNTFSLADPHTGEHKVCWVVLSSDALLVSEIADF